MTKSKYLSVVKARCVYYNDGMKIQINRRKQTGSGSVLPERAGKYFNVDNVRKDLTAEEYVKYATKKGQTAYEVVAGDDLSFLM